MLWMDRFGLRGLSTAATMNVFLFYFVCASSTDSFFQPEVNETTGITWPALFHLLRSVASTEPCRHGSPSRDFPHRCVCESNFSGDLCQRLNVSAIGHVVLGGTVILHWDRPPRLRGYSVVFQEARNATGPTEGSRLYKTPIAMREDSRSLLLDNLKGGGTPYWVCIEEDTTADMAVSTQAVNGLTSCLYVSTLPDYDSLAGWALALSLSGLTVLLIYLQRDKIELLYFSRPMTGYYEPIQQIRHQGDQESVSSNNRVVPRNPPTSIGSHP